MAKGETKYSEDKKARRGSKTHEEKVKKGQRKANKVNHRKTPRNTRGEVVACVGQSLPTEGPATKDGARPLPTDSEGEEELTVVG